MSGSPERGNNRAVLAAMALGCLAREKRIQLLRLLSEGTSLEGILSYLSDAEVRRGQAIGEQCKELGIEVISFSSVRYPAQLRAVPAPPPLLYVQSKGALFEFPARILAIVGTRAASVEVCQRATLISSQLAHAGFCIVSGLALGIDGAAHRGALQSSGACPTIGVVAHGLDRVYPSTHAPLAQSILEAGGALVSEYPPYTEPLKHHFLERNRIIAALSQGVIVIQAGERSGSLVTAQYGADFGRDIFVMEGEEDDCRFSGGARLIDDGAIPIAGAREVLEEYRVELSTDLNRPSQLGAWQTMSVTEYRERTKHSVAVMLQLEMEGRIVRLPGNRVSLLVESEG